jgi:hypothetical protein
LITMNDKESIFTLIATLSSSSSNFEAKGEDDFATKANEQGGQAKSTKYKSIHSGAIHPSEFPAFGVNEKRLAATFGQRRNAQKPEPKSFLLRKPRLLTKATMLRSDIHTSCEDSNFTRKARVKAPIPSDQGQLKERVEIDRVRKNALDVISPSHNIKAPQRENELYESYIKTTRGKIPKYLHAIKQRTTHDEHITMQQVASSDAETHENENIAKALKVEWLRLNRDYLKLPVLIDTPSKKARKEEYERRLDVIERKMMLSQ